MAEIGTWGIYNIPTEKNLKNYYIINDNYTNDFGTGKVIAPLEKTSGNDRFYIIALDDIDANMHYWYYNAEGSLDNIIDPLKNDFGVGKVNTQTIMDKWNNEAYGSKNSNDMWGLIQEKVKEGWFVPSKSELAAFGDAFDLGNNYLTYGLSDSYWSSSQYTDSAPYASGYISVAMSYDNVIYQHYVRLIRTF